MGQIISLSIVGLITNGLLNILRIRFDDLFFSVEQGSVLLLLVLVAVAHVVVTWKLSRD